MVKLTALPSVLLIVALASAGAQQVRDTRAQPPAGTSTIAGRIVAGDDATQPVRRAIVTVGVRQGSDGGQTGVRPGSDVRRSTVTDDDGRFEIGDLSAGEAMITVTKRGHVPGAYGATRPSRAGTPIQLRAGQRVDVTIALFRAGVVTGRITDDRGEPMRGVRVFAINARRLQAPSASSGEPGVLTDDRGVYRIFDLAPRDYVIVATTTYSVTGDVIRRSTAETDAALARLQVRGSQPRAATPPPPAPHSLATIAPVYFPGTITLSDATRVAVRSGEVREGLDFSMRLVPVTSVEGTVINQDGPLPSRIDMSILRGSALQLFAVGSASPQLTLRPGSDGRFRYESMVPGRYTIMVRANDAPAPPTGRGRASGATPAPTSPGRGRVGVPTDTRYAVESFEVTGQPVGGLSLVLRPGARVRGRVVVDATTQQAPADLSAIRLTLLPVGHSASDGVMSIRGTRIGDRFAPGVPEPIGADGSFEFGGVAPGAYRILTSMPPAIGNWWLRSAMANGVDVFDIPLDLEPGAAVDDLVVTLTDRRTELTGTLQAATGIPAPEHFIIVMPADAALRTADSRRVKSTRPATDGRYTIAELPPGDYLLVALTDVDPDAWREPAFLNEIASAGVRVAITEGDRTVQDLRIRR
jgi:hypothetical protein